VGTITEAAIAEEWKLAPMSGRTQTKRLNDVGKRLQERQLHQVQQVQ